MLQAHSFTDAVSSVISLVISIELLKFPLGVMLRLVGRQCPNPAAGAQVKCQRCGRCEAWYISHSPDFGEFLESVFRELHDAIREARSLSGQAAEFRGLYPFPPEKIAGIHGASYHEIARGIGENLLGGVIFTVEPAGFLDGDEAHVPSAAVLSEKWPQLRAFLRSYEFPNKKLEALVQDEAARAESRAEARSKVELERQQAGKWGPSPTRGKKRSTAKGDARAKIIAALTAHHKYDNGSALNLEPIGVNELARTAEVSNSTVSEFFKEQFGEKGHAAYATACGDAGRLVGCLRTLRGEWCPKLLLENIPSPEAKHTEEE
jgi:hypothetical protein